MANCPFRRETDHRRVDGRVLGQIQRAIDEGLALVEDIGRKHPDLAVPDLAGRSRILPIDAAGKRAVLQKARLVDLGNALIRAQMLEDENPDDISKRIRVPSPVTQQGLQLPGTGITRGFACIPWSCAVHCQSMHPETPTQKP